MREIVARPLTVEAFAPFGAVVSAALRAGAPGRSANMGTAVRFDFCAPVTSTRPEARGNLAVFRSTKKALPFQVTLLERHPCSTQAFLPLACARFLVVVAPTGVDGSPDVDGLLAFACTAGQGISYAVGVWHHPIIALDDDADFAMLAFEDGSPADCVERLLDTPIRIIERS